jgi:ABC-type multidrug transport system ATPase subunit
MIYPMKILEIRNLHKSYGPKKVINNVNLTVSKGDVLGFIGPNGAGKTTTIRLILGLIYADQGSIHIGGYNIEKDFNKAISQVGAMVETPKFYPYLTGYRNLALTANLHPHIPKRKIQEVLDVVGLKEPTGDLVRTYSQGMKQRLGIARALVNNPRIVFLDEPMNGLDPQGMLDVKELINQLNYKEEITFFITSHLLQEVENVCNKVAVLQGGRLRAQGHVDELLRRESEVVEITTRKAAKALASLENIPYVKSRYHLEDKLYVEIEKGFSGQLNAHLVGQGIDVSYIVPKKQTLENYFINLTRGGENRD